jgi:hypothetical protein
MGNQPQPFKTHHIARALRGAAAAGMRNPTVEVRLPTGATIVVGGAGKLDAARPSPGRVQQSVRARGSHPARKPPP